MSTAALNRKTRKQFRALERSTDSLYDLVRLWHWQVEGACSCDVVPNAIEQRLQEMQETFDEIKAGLLPKAPHADSGEEDVA